MSKIIMGIQQSRRHETAKQVQDLLTKYGCIIKTRLGVHQSAEDSCSEQGLIILEFSNNSDQLVAELEEALSAISDVVVKKMEF